MRGNEIAGMIADIQHFSLHDGPGIRTTVFVKGCNMRCAWCHNPETISFQPEMMHYPAKCIHCGGCDDECFTGARVQCGRMMKVDEVMDDIRLDTPYYGDSGGVTLSGGEPLLQPEFSRDLLAACHRERMNTAIETNLHVDQSVLEAILPFCDLVMADIKLWDSTAHRTWTGCGNEQVLQNILYLEQMGQSMILRTPLIPGVNMHQENMAAIAQFIAPLKHVQYYELLPYHPLGLGKQMATEDSPERQLSFPVPTMEQIETCAHLAVQAGVPVRISGKPFPVFPETL